MWYRQEEDETQNTTMHFKATWTSLTPQQCHMWIADMPSHNDVAILAKGGKTKYIVHIQGM